MNTLLKYFFADVANQKIIFKRLERSVFTEYLSLTESSHLKTTGRLQFPLGLLASNNCNSLHYEEGRSEGQGHPCQF